MHHEYEYTIPGFGKLIDIMEAEPEMDLRMMWMGEYIEGALQSWQYATDGEYRDFIDNIAAVYRNYEEKVTPLYSLKLSVEMLKDRIEAARDHIDNKWRTPLAKAYRAGTIDAYPEGKDVLRAILEQDMATGRYDADACEGLRPEDIV